MRCVPPGLLASPTLGGCSPGVFHVDVLPVVYHSDVAAILSLRNTPLCFPEALDVLGCLGASSDVPRNDMLKQRILKFQAVCLRIKYD